VNPKPYKQNKTALREFLERKNQAAPKVEKKPVLQGKNRFELLMDEVMRSDDEEDKARLEAAGWMPVLLERRYAKEVWEKFKKLKKADENSNSFRMFWLAVKQEPKYYVAQFAYRSREEFLLGRTGLGKELL
jgi:hypothetical protein